MGVRRRGRKRARKSWTPVPEAPRPGDHWSLDFLSDTFEVSRRFRIPTVNDDSCRENLSLMATRCAIVGYARGHSLKQKSNQSVRYDKAKAFRKTLTTDRLAGQFSSYPSSKQVGFAERIARMKRRDIPQECFQDRTMMSKWIDANR